MDFNQNTSTDGERKQPTHVAKIRYGEGRRAVYERIGAAWLDPEKGAIYVKLNGTQVVSDGFTLYPNKVA